MFIKINNGVSIYPYNINLLYSEYPNTSFPNNIQTDYESLKDFGVYKVNETQRPVYDTLLEKCVELTPDLIDDNWNQKWSVESLSTEERQVLFDSRAAEVRANRYRLLAETDWTQFKDVPTETSNKYIEYRQKLRDVTSQEGFPFNVVWPDYVDALIQIIPPTVTRFQALAVLSQAGYLDTITTYIDSLATSDITRLAFENATDWERSSPTVAALATMLNLTSAQVDDLFIAASNISA